VPAIIDLTAEEVPAIIDLTAEEVPAIIDLTVAEAARHAEDEAPGRPDVEVTARLRRRA
jgi:hypothetical protein